MFICLLKEATRIMSISSDGTHRLYARQGITSSLCGSCSRNPIGCMKNYAIEKTLRSTQRKPPEAGYFGAFRAENRQKMVMPEAMPICQIQ